ncbi:hypothetical protein [Clostridium sp.]|uniref:hypothetical protein n=1 Tax=Clostridium sp. TaxID=1506 RepID=UPI00283F6F36|nr:hypothetical protein [Clostridium sp.]MDR3597212.1 hypothetical protein [Clostridium sp.]
MIGCHSPKAVWPLLMMKTPDKESYALFTNCEECLNLTTALDYFHNNLVEIEILVPPTTTMMRMTTNSLVYRHIAVAVDIIFSSDWEAMRAYCNQGDSPSCRTPGHVLCPVCNFSSPDKQGAWRNLTENLWRFHPKDQDSTWVTKTRMWNLVPSEVVYAPLHSCARLLASFLSLCVNDCNHKFPGLYVK